MKKLLGLILGLLYISILSAQNISGTLVNEDEEPMFGATIAWEGTGIGSVADENGYFVIPAQTETMNLQIDYVGYETLLIEVLPGEDDLYIKIDGITELMAVEVAASLRDNYTSTLETLNIETIGANEFRKAPCCNLAESFQTNAAIDVSYNDAVTGAKEITLLGLRGIYTLMTVEKRPSMTGLGSAFSLEYIPGTWLSSIQIIKGSGTVSNGYQAITGQINAELMKPFQDKKIFVNLYGSTFGRGEANLHLNHKFTDKLSAGLLLHASTRKNELDNNFDGFYDTPQKEMLDGMFRSFYRGNNWRAQLNIHGIRDRHQAGQIVPGGDSPLDYYRIAQNHDRVELFAKAGYLGFENLNNTMGYIVNASWHKLDSYYGRRVHRGEQQNFYGSAFFTTAINDPKHKLDLGASYLYDNYDEQLDDTDFSRMESVPGVFAEYTYAQKDGTQTFASKFGAVIGLRVDYHNIFKTLITPRANVKYNFTDDSVIRFSAGRGFRYANVIAENVSMLASNRSIVILENLEMEDAWNYGMNFTRNFKIADREGTFAFDAFHTRFNNQVIRDMDADFQTVQFYNLNGKSYSNSILGVLSYEIFKGFDAKIGYKFNDVKMTFQDGELRTKPMVAKHRGLIALDYITPNKKLEFNTNMQLVGQSRFANLLDNPAHIHEIHAEATPAYTLFNAQLTFNVKENFEIYMGGENLSNFTQTNPIIDAGNPFGDNFDATHIYAPITGRMGYLGIRYGIE